MDQSKTERVKFEQKSGNPHAACNLFNHWYLGLKFNGDESEPNQ